MKKVFTTLALLFTSGTLLLAQLPTNKPTETPRQIVAGEKVQFKPSQQSSKRNAEGPSWFETTTAIGGVQANYSFFTLFPDTNALFTYSSSGGGTTTFANISVSTGIVFDPRAKIFQNLPFTTTKFSSYTVDSLRFQFFYRRYNSDENMNDTIVLTTFNNTSLGRGFISLYAGAADYAKTDYTVGGAGAVKTKIILTKDDTSRFAQIRTVPVNRTVMGGNGGANYFGAAITYLPGYRGYSKVEPFDTVANFVTSPVGPNRANTFRLLSYFDDGMYVESETVPANNGDRIYNHGIVAQTRQRYQTGSPVVDYYYPAFFQASHMFPVIEFLVQSPNTAINTVSSAKISDIYPNPSNNQDVVVEINSDINSASILEIMDMSGRVIRSTELSIEAGFNSVKVSTSELAKGIYFVNVKGNSINSVSKLVIE
jgi:hypothetical protein